MLSPPVQQHIYKIYFRSQVLSKLKEGIFMLQYRSYVRDRQTQTSTPTQIFLKASNECRRDCSYQHYDDFSGNEVDDRDVFIQNLNTNLDFVTQGPINNDINQVTQTRHKVLRDPVFEFKLTDLRALRKDRTIDEIRIFHLPSLVGFVNPPKEYAMSAIDFNESYKVLVEDRLR